MIDLSQDNALAARAEHRGEAELSSSTLIILTFICFSASLLRLSTAPSPAAAGVLGVPPECLARAPSTLACPERRSECFLDDLSCVVHFELFGQCGVSGYDIRPMRHDWGLVRPKKHSRKTPQAEPAI